MKSETFKNICDGVKNIVLGVSIIVAGVWSFHTFNVTQAAETAKVRYEVLAKDLSEKRSIVIKLNPSASGSYKDMILVDIVIANNGNKTEIIDIANCVFSSFYVDKPRGGDIIVKTVKSYFLQLPFNEYERIELGPNEEKEIQGIVESNELGLHVFELKLQTKDLILDESESVSMSYSGTGKIIL